MASYLPDVDHPRLSAAAIALGEESLEFYADEAEAALGITGTAYTGQDAIDLTLAVVRQINRTLAIEQRGDGLGDIKAESKGDQSFTYAVAEGKTLALIDEIAAAIVARILGGVTNPESRTLGRTVENQFVW